MTMPKWKAGNFVFDTINRYTHGRTIETDRRVYEFLELVPRGKYGKDAVLKDIETGQIKHVDADDRYGYYPLVDAKRIANIQERLDEAKQNTETLSRLLAAMQSVK